MPENDVRTEIIPLAFKGVVQKIDPALLSDGQLYSALNITSDQEGSIATRAGRWLRGSIAGETTANGIHLFPGTAYKYVSASDKLYRSADEFMTFTEVAQRVTSGSSPSENFKYKPSAVAFGLGSSAASHLFFAGRSSMRKDRAASPYATLPRWGILPVPAACSAAAIAALSKTVTTTPASAAISTSAYTDIAVATGSFDLGAFDGGEASGRVEEFFENDDYIEIDLEFSALSADAVLSDVRLQFKIGADWDTRYEKAIVQSTLTGFVQQQQKPIDAIKERLNFSDRGMVGEFSNINPDDLTARAAPWEMPAATGSVRETLRIPKRLFLPIGTLSSTVNWSSVTACRVQAAATGTASPTITVHSVKLRGGAGPNSRSINCVPYKYVACFRDPATGEEGNPSPLMVDDAMVDAERQPIQVTFHGTDDANIPSGTYGTVAIYRAGGSYGAYDLYRFVGYGTNPGITGTIPNTATFSDTASDADIDQARTVEWDNDPPVTAPPPKPYDTQINSFLYGTGDPGWVVITLGAGFDTEDALGDPIIGPGSIVTVGQGVDEERCPVWLSGTACPGGTIRSLMLHFQRKHAVGTKVSISSCTGSSCHMAIQVLDSIVCAGNANAPDMLFKSKTGRPGSFPLRVQGTGTVNQMRVGSPANPIYGIDEISAGEIVCLNRENLFIVRVSNGQMMAPLKVPAARGLFTKNAHCNADGVIYYLAHDGVYAWDGSGSAKKSEAIDWLFNNRTMNGIAPLDYAQTDVIYMYFFRNEVHLTFKNTSGDIVTWAYHTLYDRWRPTNTPTLAASFDKETRKCYAALYGTPVKIVELERQGTEYNADDQNLLGNAGTAIDFNFRTGVYTLGHPNVDKQFTDIFVELTFEPYTGSVDWLQVKLYYNHSGTADTTDTISISPAAGRVRVPLVLQKDGLSPASGRGKQAWGVSFEFVGSCRKPITIHSLGFTYYIVGDVHRGRTGDWQNSGTRDDKRYYEATIEWVSGSDVTVALDTITGLDGVTVTEGADSFVLKAGRGRKSFPVKDGIVAKAVRLRPPASATDLIVRDFNFTVEQYPPDTVLFTERSDYGHPYEKHFFLLWLKVDTNDKNVLVDIEGDGAVLQTVTVKATAANRHREFPVPVDVYAKEVRLKVQTPLATDAKFQLLGHRFEKTDLPPDTVMSSDWQDYGYDYDKYFQEVTFDVFTNNQPVTIGIQVDGVEVQTFDVTTTRGDQRRRITLETWQSPENFPAGRRIRWAVKSLPAGARWQISDYRFGWVKADPGAMAHTHDWDLLEWPYEKELEAVTFEWDTNGKTVVMLMDTLTGLAGTTQNLGVQSFTLTGPGRGINTFPINKDTICKAVRFRPQSRFDDFRLWKYSVKKENRPPDILKMTERTNLGWPCDKIFRGISADIDTGGVPASMTVEIDGTEYPTIPTTFTTNNLNRRVELSIEPEKIGHLVRTVHYPGNGGKFQVYGAISYLHMRDACSYTKFRTYEMNWGSNGWKYLKCIWLEYICAGQIRMNVYVDGGKLLYTVVLPAHPYERDVERLVVPDANYAVSPVVLNKSRLYDIELISLDDTKAFKFYRDSSRVEFYNLSGPKRSDNAQMMLWTEMTIPV